MAARKNLPNRQRPYKPRETPYRNKGKQTGPRPSAWVTGPDPRRHEQYTAFLRSRAQANFRNEEWQLTFEQFEQIWNQDSAWSQRGRSADDLMMTRLDAGLPWSRDNCYLEERRIHLQRLARAQTGKTKRKLGEGRLRNGKPT